MRKIASICLIAVALIAPLQTKAVVSSPLATRLQGYILLQTQQHGEAWYINPKDQKRYYMKDGATAYQMMRQFGLGILNTDLEKAQNGDRKILNQIKGKIVLQVQEHGEAYYVNPKTLKLTYMKDGDEAYSIMRFQSLGISDIDLETIPSGNLPMSTTQFDIGDTVNFARISFKVNSASLAQQTEGTLGTATAESGSKFIIIDASVTNITNSPSIFSSGLALIDQKGRLFNDYEDTIGKIDNYLLMRSLAPSIEERGKLIYEVPNDSISFKLEGMKDGTSQIYDILIPQDRINSNYSGDYVSINSSPVATKNFCSVSSDCEGFKIRIDFDEDPNTCSSSYCKYISGDSKQVFYLTVRGDTVDGKVVLRNLNSGTEQDYKDISSGTYDESTGKIDFTYGYYLYPNIKVDFRYIEHKGNISGDQFIGTRAYSSSYGSATTGKVTYLPISTSDSIPKVGCTIKGDTHIYSGDKKTYYTSTNSTYSSIHLVEAWFCSEQDAIAAGYQKTLQN
jgi:hypothetical protein